MIRRFWRKLTLPRLPARSLRVGDRVWGSEGDDLLTVRSVETVGFRGKLRVHWIESSATNYMHESLRVYVTRASIDARRREANA